MLQPSGDISFYFTNYSYSFNAYAGCLELIMCFSTLFPQSIILTDTHVPFSDSLCLDFVSELFKMKTYPSRLN